MIFDGGSFVYTPIPDANGADAFRILIDDGNGGTVIQFVTVTINPVPDGPIAGDDAFSTIQDAVLQINSLTLLEDDEDGDQDPLHITLVSDAFGGSAEITGGGVEFTPNLGFSGTAGFDYTIGDGTGLFDIAHVTIDVLPVEEVPNEAPQVDPIQQLTALVGMGLCVIVDATDPEGDPISYAFGPAANGTVADDGNGQYTYTPGPGFTGTDSFEVTVSDGKGNETVQTVMVEVIDLSAVAPQFNLLTSNGFAGEIGGTGNVFAAAGTQVIEVLNLPGVIDLGPGFNAGGDGLVLPGTTSDWAVVRDGSNAVLTDGDTFVIVPAGPASLVIGFGDGTYGFGVTGSDIAIGGQVVTDKMTPLAPFTDGPGLPEGLDPAASANLILFPGGEVTAGGALTVFGTNDAEMMTLLNGDATFDPSWNRGNDVLLFDDPAGGFDGSRVNSLVLFENVDTNAMVPFGPAGMTFSFDGDVRALTYDPGTDTLMIGGDTIGFTATPLSFA